MDKPMNVFDIAGRAMSAQLVRLNATASNLANAGSVTGSEDKAYRAIRPVFSTVVEKPGVATVKVDRVVTSDTPATKRHEPGAELVEMVESARMYQNNVQVLQTAKTLLLETIRLGK